MPNRSLVFYFGVERLSRVLFFVLAPIVYLNFFGYSYVHWEYFFIALSVVNGGAAFLLRDAIAPNESNASWVYYSIISNLIFSFCAIYILSYYLHFQIDHWPFLTVMVVVFVAMPVEWLEGTQRSNATLQRRVIYNIFVYLIFAFGIICNSAWLCLAAAGLMFSGFGFIRAPSLLPTIGLCDFSVKKLRGAILFSGANFLMFWVSRSELLASHSGTDADLAYFMYVYRPLVYLSGLVQVFITLMFLSNSDSGIVKKVLSFSALASIITMLFSIFVFWIYAADLTVGVIEAMGVLGFVLSSINTVLGTALLRLGLQSVRVVAALAGLIAIPVVLTQVSMLSGFTDLVSVFVVSQACVFLVYISYIIRSDFEF